MDFTDDINHKPPSQADSMLEKLLERLKEPSTWVALALILGASGVTAHLSEFISRNTTVFVEVLSSLLALIGAATPERGSQDK